jgi:hypothetical protein
MAQNAKIQLSAVAQDLQKQCWTKKTVHSCISQFQGMDNAIRNWRVLWFSLPPAERRARLLNAIKESAETHGKMKFLGRPVCQIAFKLLAGVGSSSLDEARSEASKGAVSCWSNQELNLHMDARGYKPPRYLDVRSWLEVYAEAHAEKSPMSGLYVLPAGRKMLYYLAYVEDRRREDLARLDGEPADYKTFLKAWRVECPWISVSSSLSMFTGCGICEFLKDMLDRTPRDQGNLCGAIRQRLGQHFKFQAAQRLAQTRIEEHARRSEGRHWFMKIDKMDQKKTVIPTVWSQCGPQKMHTGTAGSSRSRRNKPCLHRDMASTSHSPNLQFNI